MTRQWIDKTGKTRLLPEEINGIKILGYCEGLEIHRVNVKGNYEPSNCIFLSPEEHRLEHKTKNRS